MTRDTILGFKVSDLKIVFLVTCWIYSLLRLLDGDVLSAALVGGGSTYLLYYYKKEHVKQFKQFVDEFKEKEQRQQQYLESQGIDKVEDLTKEDNDEIIKSIYDGGDE